jgi:cytochrome b561
MTSVTSQLAPIRGYSIYQIALHWLIAALVIFQLFFGESMTEFVDAEEGEPVSTLDANLAGLHYYVGISILALVAIRLPLRFWQGAPPPLDTNTAIELAGRISHWLFYVLLVCVPVTGLLGYYVGDPYADIHSWAKPVFIGLIALHVAASLYHQFWRKDGLLTRMLRPASGLDESL